MAVVTLRPEAYRLETDGAKHFSIGVLSAEQRLEEYKGCIGALAAIGRPKNENQAKVGKVMTNQSRDINARENAQSALTASALLSDPLVICVWFLRDSKLKASLS